MAKKCIICNEEAKFCIKGSSECYCADCAEEHFGDVGMLVEVEKEAERLKKVVEDHLPPEEEVGVNIKKED